MLIVIVKVTRIIEVTATTVQILIATEVVEEHQVVVITDLREVAQVAQVEDHLLVEITTDPLEVVVAEAVVLHREEVVAAVETEVEEDNNV